VCPSSHASPVHQHVQRTEACITLYLFVLFTRAFIENMDYLVQVPPRARFIAKTFDAFSYSNSCKRRGMTPRQLSKLLHVFSTAGYPIHLPHNFIVRSGFAVLENAEKQMLKADRALREE